MTLGDGRLLNEDLRGRVSAVNAGIALDEGGGATLAKVLMLADIVVGLPVRTAVEIGVYRGRLLLPLALVVQRAGGQIFGIDPYSAIAAEQHDEHAVGVDLRAWPSLIDWDGLHAEVLARIEQLGIQDCCHLVRARSADAAARFERASVDLLHIDGNHDASAVASDARLYLPLVRAGGYVVLDDIGWESIRPVFEFLRAHHELLFALYDGGGLALDGVGGNDFAVFRLRPEGPAYEPDRVG
jgi:hypothetical protein